MYLNQFFIEGLGHASYLIGADRTGEAAVIDPRRDSQIYVDEARARGLRIRLVLETHVHNDFVSGARALAERVGADHVAPAEAGLRFPYHAAADGGTFHLGELTLRALFTPGHTPEHVAYTVTDTDRADVPVLLFSGGDLLVGSVGRPDLLGMELGGTLAPLLYDSLHEKLLTLDDYVEVLPTHGAGSLCGKAIGTKRTTTIGYERRFNAALQQPTKDAFVAFVLANNPGIPAYYRRMRPTNQAGLPAWQLPDLARYRPDEARHALDRGAMAVDLRPGAAFGAGHIPGALNVPLEDSFVTWAGWLLPSDTPLVLVLEHDDQWEDAVTRLARIGFDNVTAMVVGGFGTWVEAGLPVAQIAQRSVRALHDDLVGHIGVQVVDVRTDSEWSEGHIAGAQHVMLGALPEPERLATVDRGRPVAVICGGGYRSAIAASLLQRRGFERVVNILGGMTAWQAAGLPITTEEERSYGLGDHATEQLRLRYEGGRALRRRG